MTNSGIPIMPSIAITTIIATRRCAVSCPFVIKANAEVGTPNDELKGNSPSVHRSAFTLHRLNPPPDSFARLRGGERAAEVARRVAAGYRVLNSALDGAGRVRRSEERRVG